MLSRRWEYFGLSVWLEPFAEIKVDRRRVFVSDVKEQPPQSTLPCPLDNGVDQRRTDAFSSCLRRHPERNQVAGVGESIVWRSADKPDITSGCRCHKRGDLENVALPGLSGPRFCFFE